MPSLHLESGGGGDLLRQMGSVIEQVTMAIMENRGAIADAVGSVINPNPQQQQQPQPQQGQPEQQETTTPTTTQGIS